jgi:hypothetical protein
MTLRVPSIRHRSSPLRQVKQHGSTLWFPGSVDLMAAKGSWDRRVTALAGARYRGATEMSVSIQDILGVVGTALTAAIADDVRSAIKRHVATRRD